MFIYNFIHRLAVLRQVCFHTLSIFQNMLASNLRATYFSINKKAIFLFVLPMKV